MNSIQLKRTNSYDPDFKLLVAELDQDLRMRNGEVMDIYDKFNIIEHNDTVVIAYVDELPAACGCFKQYNENTIEVKRMFVRPVARGLGLSKQILNELETWAAQRGFKYAVLETGSKQTEALMLYPRAGYRLRDNYGQYAGMPDSICFEKKLSSNG